MKRGILGYKSKSRIKITPVTVLKASKPKIDHISRQIPPLAHTPMYLWHKFWSRKTWNVVGEFIRAYCPEGGIVFDPFAGSGITAMEALKNNRRVIACDLNPIATEIIRLTIQPINEIELYDAFKRVEKRVRKKSEGLYTTHCRNCKKDIVFDCAVWQEGDCQEVRYQSCPYCGDRREANCKLTKYDRDLLKSIESKKIREWYPTNRLYYPDGMPFKEKQQYESINQLFTRRNLQALAWLMAAIEKEPKKDLRDFLKIGFSSMVHLCSRMIAISNRSLTSHHTAFSSTGWTQHSYWYASNFMEQNVWNKFESAINGHQGLIKAKTESNALFKDKRFAKSIDQLLSGKADIFIYQGDALELMDKIPDGEIDYIFTDPPYDASIQYGELAYMWVAWLKLDQGYLKKITTHEIIRNERQHKDFEVYYSLLSSSFQKMFKVLKPDQYLTVTFHNPTFKVRNATIRAGVFAGYEFQKIHHQPLGQFSAKAMLQPFGSAQGDFYLRFYKPPAKVTAAQPEEIDEVRFEKIVVETTIALLAERAEPTPYTIIINYIDPVLAKHGFFSSLHTGLDINTVLKKHLNKEFSLLTARVGGAEGRLWWFKDTSIVPHLNEIPLTERVEQTVYRKLHQQARVTFTEVWDAVSTEFPNSLTSDSTSIMDALKIYARQVAGGYWLLKPEIQRRVHQHNEVLAILALIGKKQGYDIWIGKREQHERDGGLVAQGKTLSEYMTLKELKVTNATNLDAVENIDLLWVTEDKINACFEVEATTGMTSALMRGSNVAEQVDKFMVLPEEREAQFKNKLSSPLFKEHYEKGNWSLIFFDRLRNAYVKEKTRVDIYQITNQKAEQRENKKVNANQGRLF